LRPSHSAFTALRHRNFRLIWVGLLLSFTGSFMQNAALLWHVSLLVPPDQKGLALGAVGLVRVIPIVIFSMISGVVADAWDRRKLMLMTQTGSAIVAVALAALAFSGLTVVWPVYALAALSSAVGAFDLPARQALVPSLVPRQDLPNAISLNTIMQQTSQVLGPAIGGIVIASSNVGWAYVINAVSFIAVIVALLMMRNVPSRPATSTAHDNVSWRAALEGLRFVFRSPLIRSTMLLDFFATFFSSATALLPIFAQDILQVGATGYGWLYAAPAVGATLMSAALVFLTSRIERRGPVLLCAVAMYGAATVGFGLSRSFWITFACLALTGVADTVSMVFRNVIRQLETPDRLRGRMVGVNMIFFVGGPQLGEMEAGAVANWFGAPFSVITGGLGCLIAVEMLSRIVRFIHSQGSAAGTQLAHAGRKGSTQRPWEGHSAIAPADGGWVPVGPTDEAFSDTYPVPRPLETREIPAIADAFRQAATRALHAGFDMLELHGAHGYLIHEFLSPLTNTRTDQYGGSFDNRIRLCLEVVDAVRQVWPERMPLWLRLSATDWAPGGWDVEQVAELARRVRERGVDLIDCSSGGLVMSQKIEIGPGYQVPFAERVKREAGIATGAVGLITTATQADEIVRKEQADCVLLARQMLRDPYWPVHAAQELGVTFPWPAQYLRAAPDGATKRKAKISD